MMAIFYDMIHIDMEVYVDDILVKSRTRAEHPQALARILQRSREYNLKMNPKKCVFGVSSGKLLGFLGGGISVMAFALFGSISIPLLLTINPKSLPEETLKTHFLGFILRLCSQDR